MNNFSNKSTKPRDILFLLKDALCIKNAFLHLFFRAITSEVRQPKV